jgi:hypothetical protein
VLTESRGRVGKLREERIREEKGSGVEWSGVE